MYNFPAIKNPKPQEPDTAILIASGDLRQSANKMCWPAQEEMEKKLVTSFAKYGIKVKRGHQFDPELAHGFIWRQRMGMDIFQGIHPDAFLIIAEAVWQYSYHVLSGLRDHRGPILTVANWSGQWPGLVGLLNLNGSLTKMGVNYSTIWSKYFTDGFFLNGIRGWLREGHIEHDSSHVQDLDHHLLPKMEADLGHALAQQLLQEKAIIGVFDEGCMGMYNAIIDDEMLNRIGIYKERLSQSALIAEMSKVPDICAQESFAWLLNRGMKFAFGANEETDLTKEQVLKQLKMYIAAVNIAYQYDCEAIGIQYQQGLKDMTPASDLAEGLLNNVVRPPVYHLENERELFPGRAVPHFNEADECSGVDALITNRVWTSMGLDPATTLHDIRWGEYYEGNGINDFVWLFMISGAAPASHLQGGYSGAISERQPPMYFRLGGGTLKGVSKPGEIVWSRVFVMDNRLHADLGRATSIELPPEETERRWKSTTPQWPILHAILHGITRDQMMARHKSNHIQVAYAPSPEMADKALAAKAAMMTNLGICVHICGNANLHLDRR
jgi:hypothetical protein